ncbi:hypothetical protein [Paraliomyxa miuraensis]|uniref:hypothetical protein n=1 Tax=Paraliomyxa miuraensis TaxID=376150 RepID=UPI0022554EE9|nr:hypothetical protein [Paraliomyxa miuraensis]MCX4245153.1 hypothetical protein [Paraliomyxa miuraensis]
MPGADDTAGEKLDVWDTTLDLPDIPAPGVTDWEEDPVSGLHYRRLTDLEIQNNGWQGNLLLVAFDDSFIADVSNAVGKVTLDLPLADAHPWSLQEDLPIISVPLTHHSSRDFAGVVEHAITASGSSIVHTDRPFFHSYVQEDLDWGNIDDTAVHLFAQDDGGIVVSGATYGRTFWLEGPKEDFRDLLIIEIEPPAGHQAFLLHTQHGPPLSQAQLSDDDVAAHILQQGAVPTSLAVPTQPVSGGAPAPINQCTDGLNNAPDINDDADGCDFSCMPHPDFGTDLYPGIFPIWEYGRPFAVVGDAEWCMFHPTDWEDLLHAYGRKAEELLNWVEAPAAFPGPRVPPFRLVGVYCWLFLDANVGIACHDQGTCPNDASDYPFAGVGNKWSGGPPSYLGNVWSATDAWAADAVNANTPEIAHPLQNVAVIAFDQDPSEPTSTIGLAYFEGADYTNIGGAVVHEAWVVGDGGPIIMGRRIAHEFGHTHGLAHDMAQHNGIDGFMNDSGGPVPLLGEDDDSLVIDHSVNPPVPYKQYEVWTLFPREPTFHGLLVSATSAAPRSPTIAQRASPAQSRIKDSHVSPSVVDVASFIRSGSPAGVPALSWLQRSCPHRRRLFLTRSLEGRARRSPRVLHEQRFPTRGVRSHAPGDRIL